MIKTCEPWPRMGEGEKKKTKKEKKEEKKKKKERRRIGLRENKTRQSAYGFSPVTVMTQ